MQKTKKSPKSEDHNKPENHILAPVMIKSLNKDKKISEAYKSKIGNLFTEDDETLSGDTLPFTEKGYWGDVIKSLTIYDSDELIAGLIDRMRCASNQNYNFNLKDEYNDEELFWKEWADTINETAQNTPMGMKDVFRSIFQSLLTTGMAVPEVQWETKRINGKTYDIPNKISILPSLGVRLVPGKNFGEEDIWLGIDAETEKANLSTSDDDIKYDIRYFGDPTAVLLTKRLPAIKRDNAEAIKFNWTSNNTTLYPTPLMKRAFPSIALRHKYLEADMSLLNGIIERIIHVKVGDKDTQLFATDESGDGDLKMAANMFTADNISQMVVTPYYYSIDIIQPDSTVLLKQDKYIQTTMNILNAFGIITDPDSSSNSTNDESLNLAMFKEYVKEMQLQVASWFTKLCREVQRRNKKLSGYPKITFDTPDLDDPNIKNQFIQMYNYGLLDAYSILEKFGFDPDTIIERLKKQQRVEKDQEVFKVRTTFKQASQEGSTETVTSKIDQGGRPNKVQQETKKDNSIKINNKKEK